jgi:hypothetical protein
MFKAPIFFSTMALISQLSTVSAATICDANVYVGDQLPNALSAAVTLFEDGKNYPVRIKSAGMQSPYTPNLFCFQYEIINVGGETLPLAFWDLVDDWRAVDLDVGKSRFRNRTRPTQFETAVKGPTVVKALRSAEAESIAWKTVEDATKAKKKAENDDPFSFGFAKASSLDASVSRAIENGFLADEKVAVVQYEKEGKLPRVSDLVGTTEGVTYVNSSAEFSSQRNTFTTIIATPREGQSRFVNVRIFSPFLSALAIKPTNTDRFLDSVASYRKEPKPVLETSSVKGDSLYVESPPFPTSQRIYVVEHPITVEWTTDHPDGKRVTISQCLSVASYSPFPVTLNGSFCVGGAR